MASEEEYWLTYNIVSVILLYHIFSSLSIFLSQSVYLLVVLILFMIFGNLSVKPQNLEVTLYGRQFNIFIINQNSRHLQLFPSNTETDSLSIRSNWVTPDNLQYSKYTILHTHKEMITVYESVFPGLNEDYLTNIHLIHTISPQSLDEMTDAAVPENIRLGRDLEVDQPLGEHSVIQRIQYISEKNEIWRSYIGMGYHNCRVPHSILRNIFENPGWWGNKGTLYTQDI